MGFCFFMGHEALNFKGFFHAFFMRFSWHFPHEKQWKFPIKISWKTCEKHVNLPWKISLNFHGFLFHSASKSPYPIIVYCVINYRPYILVTFGQIWIFRVPNFLFLWIYPFFTLYEEHFTFHLQNKHSGKFANRK